MGWADLTSAAEREGKHGGWRWWNGKRGHITVFCEGNAFTEGKERKGKCFGKEMNTGPNKNYIFISSLSKK